MSPTLVPSWNRARVYGTWVAPQGDAMRAGTYKVTIPVRVTNATDDVIIPAGTFASGSLNTTPGVPSLDIELPCTDDPDNSPVGWQATIEITFPDAKGERYVIDVPLDGGDINLRSVVLTESLPAPVPVLIRGVPGGLATLDRDGDVVNAAGEKVAGGGDSFVTVEAEPLAAGASPAAEITGGPGARVLSLGIPAGAKGDKGDTGNAGAAGTITSATATMLAAGASPTVTLGGTASARTIALGIPAAASPIVTYTWTGSAWSPTIPASAPAGTTMRLFIGPEPYTGATWAGVQDLYARPPA